MLTTGAAGQQTVCAAGYYQSSVQSSCTPASAGYYVPDSRNEIQLIAAGYEHTCAILDDGYVKCWGRNDYGQLGDNTNADRTAPTATSSLGTGSLHIIISAESQTACAAGTYQANTGQSSCTDAEAGYYVNSTAQISQTACAPGYYQAHTGQSSCTAADAGYYALGTNQVSIGQISCTAICTPTYASCSLSDELNCSADELIEIKRIYNNHPNRTCGN